MERFDVSRLLDTQGRLGTLPRKPVSRMAALRWLSWLFAHGRVYTEPEVNALLMERSTAGDHALLRRELCESGLLSRTSNGARYWRNDILRGMVDCGEVSLRDLCEEDVPALLEIHASLVDYDELSGEPFTEDSARALVAGVDVPPGGRAEFVRNKMILHGGQPVGYLSTYAGYPDADTLWLGALFLYREHHRRGIGRAVLQALHSQAQAAGFRCIGLGVYAANTAGLQFWVREGYAHIDRVRMADGRRAILALSREV